MTPCTRGPRSEVAIPTSNKDEWLEATCSWRAERDDQCFTSCGGFLGPTGHRKPRLFGQMKRSYTQGSRCLRGCCPEKQRASRCFLHCDGRARRWLIHACGAGWLKAHGDPTRECSCCTPLQEEVVKPFPKHSTLALCRRYCRNSGFQVRQAWGKRRQTFAPLR